MHVGIEGKIVSKGLDDCYSCRVAIFFPAGIFIIIPYNFP
jgi:hypothetical protein